MSNWKVGPGGRLYHPTTGAYVGQLDDNGNEQMVVSAFPSGRVLTGGAHGIAYTHAQGAVNSTQTGTATTDLLLASVVIPGGALGPNGQLDVDLLVLAGANNANVKRVIAKLGNVQILSIASPLTSTRTARFEVEAYGNNSEASILAYATDASISVAAGGTGSGTTMSAAALDTTVDQTLSIYCNLASAGDSVTLQRWAVRTTYGA